MASYRVEFARSARKDLQRLDEPLVSRIIAAIESLAKDPRPRGSRKMEAGIGFRIRVGAYRIIYDIDDRKNVVDISYIRHRREAYRKRR